MRYLSLKIKVCVHFAAAIQLTCACYDLNKVSLLSVLNENRPGDLIIERNLTVAPGHTFYNRHRIKPSGLPQNRNNG